MKWRFWKKKVSEEKKLIDASHNVDLSKLALNCTTLGNSIDEKALQQRCIEFAVAQAIRDQISQSESGLAVRDLLPHIDLLDNDFKSASPDWTTQEYQLRPAYHTYEDPKTGRKIRYKLSNEE